VSVHHCYFLYFLNLLESFVSSNNCSSKYWTIHSTVLTGLIHPAPITYRIQHIYSSGRQDIRIDRMETAADESARHSFQNLSLPAQNMFLDCSTVMLGAKLHLAMMCWAAWWPPAERAQQCFAELQEKSLVAVQAGGFPDDDPIITVKDTIAMLGRSIILQKQPHWLPANPFYGSRVWVDSAGLLQEVPADEVRPAPGV